MTYPTSLAFSIASANIQNLKDLSRPDTRKALESFRGKASVIGTQETIEAEDNQDIDIVFPSADYYHYNQACENDHIFKKARYAPVSVKRLAQFKKPMLASVTHMKQIDGKKQRVPALVDPTGALLQRGMVNLGTSREHVQPQRVASFSIMEFVENPLLTPFVLIDFHFVSGVDSHMDPVAYRQQERKEQYAGVQLMVMAFKSAGLQVIFVADTNWKFMPKFTSDTQQLVNGTIDKIWFTPGTGANWDLALVDADAIKNPSDHKAFIAACKLRVNKNYKVPVVPSQPVPVPETIEDKYKAWLQKWHVDSAADAELRAMLAEI